MPFTLHPPAPQFDEFIDSLWLLNDSPRHSKERIVPSGTIELVINLRDDDFRIYDPTDPARYTQYSGAIVSGAYGRSFVIDPAQQASIIGVHFKSGGAFPFLGVSAAELASAHADLESLWGRRGVVELRERLCGAQDPAERFNLLEGALMRHVFRPLRRHDAVSFALQHLRQAHGRTCLRRLAKQAGLSQRRFIEVFDAEVGMRPKLFARVLRFQRAVRLAWNEDSPDWARLALACGYCDQSHLIRDFREFSGLCPTEYLRHRSRCVKPDHIPLPE